MVDGQWLMVEWLMVICFPVESTETIIDQHIEMIFFDLPCDLVWKFLCFAMWTEVAAYCKAPACLSPYFGEGMSHRARFCVCENGRDLNREKLPLNDGRMMTI